MLTHKKSRTKVYEAWCNMKARCHTTTHKMYPLYGGRGIDVCLEWFTDFSKFLEDMGEPPTKLHSLDRIDVNRGYCKDNCRWATQRLQSANKRKDSTQSRYVGVAKANKTLWKARIRLDGKLQHLGCFKTEIEAALRYNQAIDDYGFDKECKNIIDTEE